MTGKTTSDPFCTLTGSRPLSARSSGHYAELPVTGMKIQASVESSFRDLQASLVSDAWNFAKSKPLYQSQPLANRIALATFLVEKCPGALVQHFNDFELPKEQHFQFALACAKPAGQVFLQHRDHFDLSESERRAVFSVIAENWPQEMAETMEDLQTEPLETRKAVARTIASINGWAASAFYRNFNIPDPETRFADAKLAFANNPLKSAKSIGEYDLDEESKRFELLKIALAQDPSKALMLAKTFGISSQEYLYELAKAHADNDGWSFCCQYQEWGIEDQNRLYDLFKRAAAQNGRGFIHNKPKVSFDKEKVTELVAIASRQSGISLDEALRKE